MARTALTLLLVAACAASCSAFPSFWPGRARTCSELPSTGIACHKAPQMDPKTTIALYPAGAITSASKPQTAICAGKTYAVQLKFRAGETRLAYLTAGAVGNAAARVATANALNTKCSNTMVFAKPTGFTPSNTLSTNLVAPAAAGPWKVSVVSATGGCAAYQITTATFMVAKC